MSLTLFRTLTLTFTLILTLILTLTLTLILMEYHDFILVSELKSNSGRFPANVRMGR